MIYLHLILPSSYLETTMNLIRNEQSVRIVRLIPCIPPSVILAFIVVGDERLCPSLLVETLSNQRGPESNQFGESSENEASVQQEVTPLPAEPVVPLYLLPILPPLQTVRVVLIPPGAAGDFGEIRAPVLLLEDQIPPKMKIGFPLLLISLS